LITENGAAYDNGMITEVEEMLDTATAPDTPQ
jgi:hypothetical protein